MNTYKYKNMMFFAPDEGGGEGGGQGTAGPADGGTSDAGITRGAEAFEPTVKQTTGDRPLPGEKPTKVGEGAGPKGAETGEGEGGAPAAPTAPAGFDPNKFAQEFGATLSESLKPILTPKAPEMTPEEAKKLLKVWEPDDAWYAKYDNLETRKDAVLEMRDALVEQADTRASARMEQAIAQLQEQLNPHIQAFRAAEDRARETRFATEYPTLGKPEMQPLIKAIVQDLTERKQKFGSEKELFTAIANGVEAVIKVNNPEFKLEAASNGSGQQEKGRSGRSLPALTPGGGGGTGRQESSSKPEPKRGIAVFGK